MWITSSTCWLSMTGGRWFSPLESHSANTFFSYNMAFGGGGTAISYGLAKVVVEISDECLERYPKLYGIDDRLHACISEIGVPLSKEYGFHKRDIKGNVRGILSAHPIAPFISVHHLETVDPFYPDLSLLEGLQLFAKAMRMEPPRASCSGQRVPTMPMDLCFWFPLVTSFRFSLTVIYPHDLERSKQTYSAWNGINHRNEFDFDTKNPMKSFSKMPLFFYLKDVERDGNATLGTYLRAGGTGDLRKRVFCSPAMLRISRCWDILWTKTDIWHHVECVARSTITTIDHCNWLLANARRDHSVLSSEYRPSDLDFL